MLLTEALDRFGRDRADGISKQTLHTYKAGIRSLAEHGMTTTRDLTRARVAEWVSARMTRELAISTINVQLAGVLSVLSHLERRGLFPLQRLLELRRLRERALPSLPPVFLTRDELARLLVAALSVHPLAALSILLAVFAGLRLSELQELERSAVFLDGELPYVFVARDGHGRRSRRTVPIARAFAKRLSSELPTEGPVFPALHSNSPTGRVGKKTFQVWLGEARDRARLYHVTWFTLRHSFASYLRQGGVELSKLSGWMGNTVRICEKHYAALAPGGDPDAEKIAV